MGASERVCTPCYDDIVLAQHDRDVAAQAAAAQLASAPNVDVAACDTDAAQAIAQCEAVDVASVSITVLVGSHSADAAVDALASRDASGQATEVRLCRKACFYYDVLIFTRDVCVTNQKLLSFAPPCRPAPANSYLLGWKLHQLHTVTVPRAQS